MLITCPCKALRSAFLAAATFANKRHKVHDVLAFVRLKACQDGVVLQATNMDVGASVRVDGAEVRQQGEALVHAETFANLIKALDDGTISIEAGKDRVIVSADHGRWKLATRNAEEFPDAPLVRSQTNCVVPKSELQRVIERTVIATDETASRYAFGGVLFEIEAGKLIAVATDGRRLAKMEIASVAGDGALAAKPIIPAKALEPIASALSIASDEIRISSFENHVAFDSDRASFWALAMDGRFPQWRAVLPRRPDAARFTIPVGQVKSLLKQAALVLTNDYRGVDFRFSGSTLTLASASEVFGEARVELPVHYQGPPLAILMDHRFVLDFLEVLPEKTDATMEVEDEERAVLFSADEGAYEYVVMPMSRDKAPTI
jgi:DNA polymerase-3 subunit beta